MLNILMSDVMVIGDNNNDVFMFELVGVSYVMGNVSFEVK